MRQSHLTRSNLHRGLQRHGFNRRLDTEDDKRWRSDLKRYPLGTFPIAIATAAIRTVEGRRWHLPKSVTNRAVESSEPASGANAIRTNPQEDCSSNGPIRICHGEQYNHKYRFVSIQGD